LSLVSGRLSTLTQTAFGENNYPRVGLPINLSFTLGSITKLILVRFYFMVNSSLLVSVRVLLPLLLVVAGGISLPAMAGSLI
jgi:hypothetical protein